MASHDETAARGDQDLTVDGVIFKQVEGSIVNEPGGRSSLAVSGLRIRSRNMYRQPVWAIQCSLLRRNRLLSCSRVRTILAAVFACSLALPALAVPPRPWQGASELRELLDRLNTLGSILILGAHPDDERETMIAYFSRGRNLRTAYLSATRGEGGQNLIGPEQAELLGIIRTQELLAARRLDGGEQFFTRAIDFGYSKSPQEALSFWGKEQVLGDMVRVIRRFRPDVILSRFSPDESSGHGHHTAIGHLAREAYEASADPERFPEQIEQGLQPWQATRLYWSPTLFTRAQEEKQAMRSDRIRINTGEYDPELGASYAEIGGVARSMHRSQGMGTRQRKGDAPAFFGYVAGERAERDLIERINTTWDRVRGAEHVKILLTKVSASNKAGNRDAVIEGLFRAYREVKALDGPWARRKEQEMVRAIELASGLWIDAAAEHWNVTPGSEVEMTLSAMNRSSTWLHWEGADVEGLVAKKVAIDARHLGSNEVAQKTVRISIPEETEYSQPAWLRRPVAGSSYQLDDPGLIGQAESRPPLSVSFHLKGPDGVKFTVVRPVIFRWVDPTAGERTRRVEVVPAVAVSLDNSSRIFPDAQPRTVAVDLESHTDRAEGSVSLSFPAGWKTEPAALPFRLERRGMRTTLAFALHPPKQPSGGAVVANVKLGDQTINQGVREIEYPHIPLQVVFPRAEMRVERADITLLAKNIGYVMGSGDRIPEALEQLEAEVRLLSDADVASGELSSFDTIVLGIRALNTRPGVLAAKERLLGYIESGGTLIVQYTTLSRRGPPVLLAPFPLTPSRERVSDERAPVRLLHPRHTLLQQPNAITEKDFEDWVQERGLYFMTKWDTRYDALLASNDPGELPRRGGLLYARYGKGVYIFTGYSWFRQLPLGVPGAYRIFANLLSAGATASE